MTEAARPGARVRLLGDVRIEVSGEVVVLAGRMPRAIVARLALAGGRVVDPDELEADLWDEPSPTANVSIRSYVSRLRSTPLAPLIAGGRGGYRLAVSPEDVDLLHFESLARPAASDSELDEALALWHDAVLPGLDAMPFARAVHSRVSEVHRTVVERVAERMLERTEVRAAIALVEPVAARYPDHETPAALLATAFSRAGRSSDALAVLDAFQRRRADALGLDPSTRLASLRQSIVRLDPDTSARHGGDGVTRHGLPTPLTVFVGRERELDAIRVARQNSRLVTLVGPGGVGKTRLAIEAASRVGHHDDAEQWFLELAPLADSAVILASLASLVGANAPTIEAVNRTLSGRRGLLVFDNAEHVLAPAIELCRAILEGTTGVGIVVTSRTTLGIPGERRVEVNPLLGADTAAALRLFCDRADDVVPGLRFTAAELAQVDRIVTALDGLPLALELAAARLATMSLAELAHAVDDQAMLSGDPQGGRHSGLAATIRWSTDLVSSDERHLLRQLARFSGVFTAEAVAGICRPADDGTEGGGGPVVAAALARLARASLVAVIREEDGTVAYRLLESIKAVAQSFDPSPDDAWSVRHAEWHAAFAAEHEPRLHGEHEAEVSAMLDRMRADLGAAIDDSHARGARTRALRLVSALGWYWFRRGMLHDGRVHIERALALSSAGDPSSDGDLDVALRAEARAQAHLALLLFQLGEPDASLAASTAGLELVERTDDAEARAILLSYLSYWHAIYGDATDALRFSDAAEAIDAPGWSGSLALILRGQALRSAGRPAAALDVLTRVAALTDEGGDRWVSVVARAVRSKVLMDLKRGREALALLLPITRLSTAQQDPSTTLTNLYLVAGAAALVEQHAAGARLIGAAEALGRRIGWNAAVSEPVDFVVYRERVRQGLPPALWEALLDDGARLTLGEAVAFALRLAPFAAES